MGWLTFPGFMRVEDLRQTQSQVVPEFPEWSDAEGSAVLFCECRAVKEDVKDRHCGFGRKVWQARTRRLLWCWCGWLWCKLLWVRLVVCVWERFGRWRWDQISWSRGWGVWWGESGRCVRGKGTGLGTGYLACWGESLCGGFWIRGVGDWWRWVWCSLWWCEELYFGGFGGVWCLTVMWWKPRPCWRSWGRCGWIVCIVWCMIPWIDRRRCQRVQRVHWACGCILYCGRDVTCAEKVRWGSRVSPSILGFCWTGRSCPTRVEWRDSRSFVSLVEVRSQKGANGLTFNVTYRYILITALPMPYIMLTSDLSLVHSWACWFCFCTGSWRALEIRALK